MLTYGIKEGMYTTSILPGYHQLLQIRLEQGILQGTKDFSGFTDVESFKTHDRFYMVSDNFDRVFQR